MMKLSAQSKDLSQENIKKVEELFPNCVTESYDKDGNLVRSIDFDVLRQDLSGHVVEGQKERYQFNWPGKREAILLANAPTTNTLRPLPEKSVDFENTKNVYIEGDNLEALKILRETYMGKIKMIYIDPPYNTGNDFVYKDDFKESTEEYLKSSGNIDEEGNRMAVNGESNGRFHSDWLNMMYPRLILARDLLTDDGLIFISIGNQEIDNLKKMLSEIFGDSCFLGIIDWESKTKCQNTDTAKRQLQNKQEYILVFEKTSHRYEFNLRTISKRDYPEIDENGKRFRYEQIGEMASSGTRGRQSMVFDILGVLPKPGNQWKFGTQTINLFLSRNDLVRKNDKVFFRLRPEDEEDKMEPFWSFYSKEIGTGETAKSELKKIVGSGEFETVKPVSLIEDLAFHVLNDGDIILDFFSGSGTTAASTMKLNAEQNLHCKYVLVQIPESFTSSSVSSFSTLCDLGEYRIKKTAEKIETDFPLESETMDLGFRVFKTDSSNMKDILDTPKDTQLNLLEDADSAIKPDRNSLDLVTQVMLQLGITLDAEIKIGKCAGGGGNIRPLTAMTSSAVSIRTFPNPISRKSLGCSL